MFRTAISSQAQCAQDGKDVPVGSIGEVLLKTPSLPLGYWEDPEATKELFQDGAWTGSVGLDHFSGNCLSFLGRMWVDKPGKTIVGNRTHLFWSFAGLENLEFYVPIYTICPICTPIYHVEMAMSLAKPCGVRYAWMILGVSGQVGK